MQKRTLLAFSGLLLSTTCLVSPSLAANVVGSSGVSATNFGPVNATIPVIGTATITTSVLGTIGASGTGAGAGDSIDQLVGPGSMNLTTIPTNTINQSGGGANSIGINHGTVNASVTITGNATINATSGSPFNFSGGVGNTIGGQAVGASAAASIGSRFVNVTTTATGTPSSNAINLGTNILSANNDAKITVNQVTIGGNASITSGQSNSIGGSAVGATAGASIAQAVVSTQYNNGTNVDLTSLPTNRVDAGNISATNTGAVDVYSTPVAITGTATIGNGVGNSITAQAVGASANAGISSQFEYTTTVTSSRITQSTNVVSVGTLTASNSATVWSKETIGGAASVSNLSPGAVNAGNSIGATSVGASAGASISQSVDGTASTNVKRLPSNTVATGNVDAHNYPGAEVAAQVTSGAATIGGGFDNSIGAQSVGASATASIVTRNDTWNNNFDSFSGSRSFNIINPSGTPTLTSNNEALVDAGYTVTGNALISLGVGNNIGASAVGASAGAGITQTARQSSGGMSPSDFPNNTINVGNVSATNTGTVDISAYLPFSVSGTATITTGLGNSISAQGVGASAGASIGSKFDLLQIAPALGSPPATTSANAVNAGTLTAANAASVTTKQTVAGSSAINGGVANTIGASAVGASASSSIAQSVTNSTTGIQDNLKVLPTNTVITGALQATNSGQIYATFTEGVNATIADGIGNSIGAQAAGASASAQISSRFDTVSTASVNGGKSFNSIDPPSITATNNSGGLIYANVTIGGNAAITNGIGNSIGASAFGASASAGIAQSASGVGPNGGFDLTTVPNNSVVVGGITATNDAKVDVTTTPFVVTGTASIADGVSNAISGQAVGSSASAAISSTVYGLSQASPLNGSPSTNTVVAGALFSSNHGQTTATVNIGSTAAISNGVSNSISANAVGASGGASIDQSVAKSSGALTLAALPSNSVTTTTIDVGNTVDAPVNAVLTVGGTSTTIPTGMSNSIGSRATGASGQASISSQFAYLSTTVGGSPSTNTVNTGAITSINYAAVGSQTTLGTGGSPNAVSINGGVSNSIGASATGSSALSSINQIAYSSTGAGMDLATLPSNNVTTGLLSSTNNNTGAITASLTLAGTSPSATIGGGIGNSISAAAVGASAGASITQHISSVATLP